MPPRKKSTSSDSSCSSSGSSSSSSSSGSDSGSSSSDSDSSSTPSVTKSAEKVVRRRSSESAPKNPAKPENEKTVPQQPLQQPPTIPPPKEEKKVSKSSVSSSDDSGSDDSEPPVPAKKPAPVRPLIQANDPVVKKKPIVENKGNRQITSGILGGHTLAKASQIVKSINSASSKTNQQLNAVKKPDSHSSKNKKKSIFSPENSTDTSDDDDDDEKPNVKGVGTSAQSSTNKPENKLAHLAATAIKAPARGRGRPRKQPLQNAPTPKSKSPATAVKPPPQPPTPAKQKASNIYSDTSSSSDSSSSESSSSDSSEGGGSSHNASPSKKGSGVKRPLEKTPQKKDISDSDEMKQTRKLTRSTSTRKSKHLLGKNASETESDDSTKRSVSKSPVKRAPIVPTKGKAKNNISKKEKILNIEQQETEVILERKCPYKCDSIGHLGGQYDKHFTIEACPMYHNMTIADTEALFLERRKHDEDRKKAPIGTDLTRKNPTPEQKLFLQKAKDSRAKFKPTHIPEKRIEREDEMEKEPKLNGIVSEYDLQLFREAQALASENMENELKQLPASKGTKFISMGRYCMEVWYQSPYPEDAARLPKLYLCEFCLRYQKSDVGMKRHAAKCVWRHPPGNEIYRKGRLGVWQVDGKRNKQYCQHLCLLAKFFLDHKTLYYDVEPFLFYVMTLADSDGCHTVGYFSKEKNSFLNYNVSCILTLPPYQRKGYGRLLIDFSYLLTRVEGKIGSPEKPLSDLGLISYRSYWKDVLLAYLCSRPGTTLSIKDISQEMAINSYDIVSTLQALGMMKYWKGKHIILKKQDVLEEYEERVKKRGNVLKIDPACLKWDPFVPSGVAKSEIRVP